MFLTMVEGTSQSECKCNSGMDKTLRRFFHQCLARKGVACDVDEALWSDQTRLCKQDPAKVFFLLHFACIFFCKFFQHFLFQFAIFCEHVSVPSNANISAVHMLH